MLFSDSSVAVSPSLRQTRPVQAGGLADENNASFYARIQQAKQAPAVSPSLGASTATAEPTATSDSPVEPAGGFQQFQQQLVRMWRRWKKGILIGGGLLASATVAISAFFLTKHLRYENQTTNLIPEGGEFAHLWGRFKTFEHDFEQIQKASTPEEKQAYKTKLGNGLVTLFQDALQPDKFVCNEISPKPRDAQASRMIKILINYALDYEPDVLPTFLRDLHARKRISEFLPEDQVPAIETPFRRYIEQYKEQFNSDSLLKASYEGYLNDRRGIELFKYYHVAKDAKNVVRQALLFLQSRTANQPESHLEMACMLDLYATYFKQYHPQAYDALTPLAKKLDEKAPMSPSTFTPQEDLAGLTTATQLNYRQSPWERPKESIDFSGCLRELIYKIMAQELIIPQNYEYHQKMRKGKGA
jgi:hypothetical protein